MSAVIRASAIPISDADLEQIAVDNPGWSVERADDGALIMAPTSTSGGARSAAALGQLWVYATRAGGKVFDSSTGFKTAAGGVVCPDAAWMSAHHAARFLGVDGFWTTMPDIAIEVASSSDVWSTVCRKIEKYAADGARYAVAVDPFANRTFARGVPPPDFVLDVAAIIDA